MSWTVHFTLPGSDVVLTRVVAHLGSRLIMPRSHGSVRWFTYAVFIPTAIDESAHTVTARYSHAEKHHMDRPRDPARIPA